MVRIGKNDLLRWLIALASAAACGTAMAQAGAKPDVIRVTPELIKAAQKEGKVYVRFPLPLDTAQIVAGAFKKKYGIDVDLERRQAAESTVAFATEERAGRHIVDVHVNSDRRGMMALVKEGLYAPYKLANDSQYDASVKVENYAVAPFMSNSILGYNTDRLSPADAERLFSGTWKGLLDPRFKNGRIGIVNPLATSGSSLWYWALRENPKYGESFLRAVAASDPVIFQSGPGADDALQAGEVDLLIGNVLDTAQVALMRGAKIAWVFPDVLAATPTVFHFISAKAPHPNAARLYIAWILSEEGQKVWSMDAGRSATIKAKVPQDPKLLAALQQQKWYRPYPENVKFTPSVAQMIEREDGYRKEMLSIFRVVNRR